MKLSSYKNQSLNHLEALNCLSARVDLIWLDFLFIFSIAKKSVNCCTFTSLDFFFCPFWSSLVFSFCFWIRRRCFNFFAHSFFFCFAFFSRFVFFFSRFIFLSAIKRCFSSFLSFLCFFSSVFWIAACCFSSILWIWWSRVVWILLELKNIFFASSLISKSSNKDFSRRLQLLSIRTVYRKSSFSAFRRATSVVSFLIVLFNLRACESIASSTTDFINRWIFLQSASDNAKEEEWLETDLAFDLICFMTCDELKDSNSVFSHSLLMLADVKAAWYAG